MNLRSRLVLDKIGCAEFKVHPYFQQGQTQTIVSRYYPQNSILSDQRQHHVTLPDSDIISLIENGPTQINASTPIVLMVHGLTGSHRSKYLVRLGRQFVKQGMMIFRMNLRGCGTGRGLARNLYHSGRSEDVRAVLHWISARYPSNPITVIGFSLGANIILKMAGEVAPLPASLTSFMAVSPPLSLYRSVKLLIHRANKIFNDHFVKELIKDARYRQQLFPEIKAPVYSKTMTVYDFDDVYTAPLSGYQSAKDYYVRCSSNQFINNIRHPTLILGAIDDPVISRYDYLKLPHKDNLDVIVTKQGGHVGWLGQSGQSSGVRWMDDVLIKWHGTIRRSIA